jgi:signal transduction histidine kinase
LRTILRVFPALVADQHTHKRMETHPGPPPNPLNLPLEPSHSGITPRMRWVGWLALMVVGPLLLLMLKLLSLDQAAFHNPRAHVLISGSASFLGVALALLVLQIARRLKDGRVFLVGMGFLSTASIFLLHSITTPDVFMTGRGIATSWSAVLSLVLGGIFFALSGLNLSTSLNRWIMRHARTWLIIYMIGWLTYSWIFLIVVPELSADPTAFVRPQPTAIAQQVGSAADDSALNHSTHQPPAAAAHYTDDSPASTALVVAATPAPLDIIRIVLVIAGLGCYTFAVGRHSYLYRRAPTSTSLAIICGIALFGEALLTQQLATVYSLSFWLYHAEEFVGFSVISYAVFSARRHGQSGETMLENLILTSTRARLQDEYAASVDGLVETLSRGEQPAPALSQALRARFGLTESQLGVLEQAARAVARERQQRQELEHLNATLHKLEHDKDELIQMVVHDLKNPLTALVGFLEILLLDSLSDMQRQLLENALRSSRNLSGLISDLLDVGRLEEGHLELALNPLAPRDLLVDCAAEMSAWMIQDNKTIRIDAPAAQPMLHADSRLMRRVLLNLLSNAIKHTPSGTQITLRAYAAERGADPTNDFATQADLRLPVQTSDAGAFLIEVQDDGPGIPPEHLGRIFDKFGRVNGERISRQDSTGLGLTFCRLAVEAHGGVINVISTLGQGTTFRIVLPLR